MPTCDKCDREFDTDRGLSVHKSQMHEDEETTDQSSSGQETVEKEKSFGNVTLKLSFTHALFATFVVGVLFGGFFIATVAGITGTGFTGAVADSPQAPTQDAGNNNNGGNNGGSPSDGSVDPSQISLDGEPMLGDSNAPVTMVLFEDYECPFCKRFEQNAFPQIVSDYVETGKVRVVWKDLPLPERIHPWADEGAEAMECVYRVGGNDAFWAVKKKVFDSQDQISKSTVYDQVKQWAVAEGVSGSALQQCYDNGAMSEVNQDKQEASSLGASGTPTAFINGQKIVGAQPYAAFKQVIESELGN